VGGQDPSLALAAAISGGGHRAANFAAGVLLELEQLTTQDSAGGNLLSEIDYFSTVSGGGFAAAAYISSLHDYIKFNGTKHGYSFAKVLRYPTAGYPPVTCPCKKPPPAEQITDPCIRRHLQGFYSGVGGDLWRDVLSWATIGILERPGHFEKTLDDDVLGQYWRKKKLASLPEDVSGGASLTLGDVFVDRREHETRVQLPYWVANATVYENGAIFPFTPDHLKLYRVCGYRHRLTKYSYVEDEQEYDEFIRRVPLAVGMTASANFPVATVPTILTSDMDANNPFLHLLDGGVAENLGVITALRLLRNEPCREITTRGLIVIDAYQGTFVPFSRIKQPPPIGDAAMRVTDISLDSWRGRYREIVRNLCANINVAVVFLSFDDTADLRDFGPLFAFGLEREDVAKLSKKKSEGRTPFELLRRISTLKLEDQGRLSMAEQKLLLAAGRYVVKKKKEEMLDILNW
jgi:hypothetical protein